MKLLSLVFMLSLGMTSLGKVVCNGVTVGEDGRAQALPIIAEIDDDGNAILVVQGQMSFKSAVKGVEMHDADEELESITATLRNAEFNYDYVTMYKEYKSESSLVTFNDSRGNVTGAMVIPTAYSDGGVGFGADIIDTPYYIEGMAITMMCDTL